MSRQYNKFNYLISKLLTIGIFAIALTGCARSKQYSIYNDSTKYELGSSKQLIYPQHIKLRASNVTYYNISEDPGLPKPSPSLLPPTLVGYQVN